jgi:predicted permease
VFGRILGIILPVFLIILLGYFYARRAIGRSCRR